MRLSFLIFSLFFSVLLSPAADAQDGFENLPALPSGAMDDDEPIRMTPDGPAVIKLDEDAASVIVGNPSHATAIMENPRLIMLVPAVPGATKVMVLDRDGKAIFNRHVLVGGGKAGFVRVNRACANADRSGCRPVSMFYCPDRCYETTVNTGEGGMPHATGDVGVPALLPPTAADDDTSVTTQTTTTVISTPDEAAAATEGEPVTIPEPQ